MPKKQIPVQVGPVQMVPSRALHHDLGPRWYIYLRATDPQGQTMDRTTDSWRTVTYPSVLDAQHRMHALARSLHMAYRAVYRYPRREDTTVCYFSTQEQGAPWLGGERYKLEPTGWSPAGGTDA